MKYSKQWLVATRTLALVLALAVAACSEDPLEEPDPVPAQDVWISEPDTSTGADDVSLVDASNPGLDAPAQADTADAAVGEDEQPAAPLGALADGLELVGIEAFQTIETRLVEAGERVESPIPLIALRETLFRVLVVTPAGWTPRPITLHVRLTDTSTGASQLLTTTQNVAASSTPGERASALELRVPGAVMTAHTSAAFYLVGEGAASVDSAGSHLARWPRDNTSMPLAARATTGTLHLVLVPMRFDTDGSGRLPDTSPAQLALFEQLLRAIYPAHVLRLEVREPIAWTTSVRWGDFNRELRALKQADGAEHAYYYGLIRPKETFAQYCSGTCTTGQSFTVSSADATSYRVGSGVGFSGEDWAWTLVHELGHMHGRGHAPCGVSFWSADSSYPHTRGIVGVRGWDARNDTLFGPSEVTDFMGYCDDTWVSDYTYLGLLTRMQQANALPGAMGYSIPSRWRYINWSDTEAPSWGRDSLEVNPTTGQWATASFFDADGRTLDTLEIPHIVYAHDGERSVLVPQPPAGTARVQIDAPSKNFTLAQGL
ncbi:MAG: hypothetical protein H0U74_22280 [Bradymonadaceae bacterium]|nr:hypothetical protein [Lujinxingiaceae bacterium]